MRKEQYSIGELTVDRIMGGASFDMFTKKFFVDPVNGSDGNTGKSISQAKKTLTAGKGLLTANKNEALILVPGASAMTLTSVLDWNLAYTHLIGLAQQRMNARCRINATVAGTPLFTVSAAGCTMANFLVSQEGSHATSYAVALYITGSRNHFENVHVRNIGALAVVNAAHRSLKLGAIEDTYFKNCQFGETSYDAVTAASTVIEFAGAGGKYLFEDCIILGAGSADATFFTMPANIGGFTLFKRCLFHNSFISDLDKMTQAFSISGTGNDGVFLMDCLVSGASAYETSDSGMLFGRHAYAAATTDVAVALTF